MPLPLGRRRSGWEKQGNDGLRRSRESVEVEKLHEKAAINDEFVRPASAARLYYSLQPVWEAKSL